MSEEIKELMNEELRRLDELMDEPMELEPIEKEPSEIEPEELEPEEDNNNKFEKL